MGRVDLLRKSPHAELEENPAEQPATQTGATPNAARRKQGGRRILDALSPARLRDALSPARLPAALSLTRLRAAVSPARLRAALAEKSSAPPATLPFLRPKGNLSKLELCLLLALATLPLGIIALRVLALPGVVGPGFGLGFLQRLGG